MVSKPRIKQRLRLFIIAMLISIITIQSPLTVYADADYNAWARSIVDSISSNVAGGTDTVKNGVKYTRTGYLCYLLTADGAVVDPDGAIAFTSPGYAELSGAKWICKSRKGHTVSTFAGGVAPWALTPWQEGGSPSNEPAIKEWFQTMTGNSENGTQFVYDNWGYDAAINYTNNKYIIVVETIMHFQWSVSSGNASDAFAAIYRQAEEYVDSMSDASLILYAEDYGYTGIIDIWLREKETEAGRRIVADIRTSLKSAIANAAAESDGGKYTTVGDPVIGTVPNLLKYKQDLGISGSVLASYTNHVAPVSERIIPGGAGEKAGFVAWTGSTSSRLTDDEVFNYGVAMFVVKATTDMQTTCNEPQAGTPHDPPKESEGKVTIVKSYRDKINNVYTHKATTHRSNLGTQILIENEKEYQVVEWVTSSTTNTGVKGYVWSPPVAGVSQRGTTPTSVTLSPTEKCLYVLLEKVEEEEEEEKPYNYKLTQSMITRRVWFSNPDPDYDLPNMKGEYKIEDYGFIWSSPAHNICNGHTYYGDCAGNHPASCDDVGCTVGCPDDCANPHHEDTCLDGCMTQHEHEKCKHQL